MKFITITQIILLDIDAIFMKLSDFYAPPVTNVRGDYVLPLSVCLSVCPLCLKKFV